MANQQERPSSAERPCEQGGLGVRAQVGPIAKIPAANRPSRFFQGSQPTRCPPDRCLGVEANLRITTELTLEFSGKGGMGRKPKQLRP